MSGFTNTEEQSNGERNDAWQTMPKRGGGSRATKSPPVIRTSGKQMYETWATWAFSDLRGEKRHRQCRQANG